MKKIILFIVVGMFAGCALEREYNPLKSSIYQAYLLNESALAQVTIGMPQEQVHRIMGQAITIGYSFSKPLTISNPYKIEDRTIKDKSYQIEYYVHRINQADGVVSNDELIPLVFCEGVLIGKGWDYLKTLR